MNVKINNKKNNREGTVGGIQRMANSTCRNDGTERPECFDEGLLKYGSRPYLAGRWHWPQSTCWHFFADSFCVFFCRETFNERLWGAEMQLFHERRTPQWSCSARCSLTSEVIWKTRFFVRTVPTSFQCRIIGANERDTTFFTVPVTIKGAFQWRTLLLLILLLLLLLDNLCI